MPAPLAKGPGSKHHPDPPSPSPHARAPQPPNHPFTTGLIIAASVIVAAGIAIYESPQVRQWIDQSRRKIAVALHNLGDDIQPRRPSESSDDFEARKQQAREEIIRKNRNELIRRAREEGIAVDLDELARIGNEDIEMAERRQRRKTNASEKSFDDLVGSDGMLKKDVATVQTATGTESSSSGLRQRGVAGVAGFAAGSFAAAAMVNPFSDDHILFDRDEEEAPSPKPFVYSESGSRDSSVTIDGDEVFQSAAPLIDLTPESVYLHPEDPQTASIPHSEVGDAIEDAAAQSFYSFTSASSSAHAMADDEPDVVSTGTLTPRSDRSGSMSGISVIGSQADDIGILSMQNDSDHDARSEIFSESGFTEAGFSEAGFSEVGENRGILTPSSWSDVGSDDESTWGEAAGHVSQIQQ